MQGQPEATPSWRSALEAEPYRIRDHGLIADGYTCALVHRSGTVTWMCLPRFDSAAIFGALLDAQRGGLCSLRPVNAARGRMRYLPRTNILATEFHAGRERVRLTDWMPVRGLHSLFRQGAICRLVESVNGSAEIEMLCAPRLSYGRRSPEWECNDGGGRGGRWWSAAGALDLHVSASCALQERAGALEARTVVEPGKPAWLVISWGEPAPAFLEEGLRNSLAQTRRAWENWAGRGQYAGPYRELVLRSALALKALVYEPTGAVVAAPTTSLPEAVGGSRNWDYRYCWPRDASFALYGLSLLGYHEEASRFLHFIAEVAERQPLPLQVCYRVDGSARLPEKTLPHWRGYAGSRPVRIGNGAVEQYQLDIYGEVLDAAYTYAKWRGGLERNIWQVLAKLASYAATHWQRPDNGIWEVRGGMRHFVYSKVMCWVAVDRALKLASRYGLTGPVEQWRAAWKAIREDVFRRGYDTAQHAFVQSYGSTSVDASTLLLPLVRFLKPREPRMLATMRAVRKQLARGPFLRRYANTEEDGIGEPEGAFLICSFWMIDCLTLTGRTEESRRLFEEITSHGGSLGLFSEEMDWDLGQVPLLLGNYPQGFTHMALINSAHNLELYPRGVPS